MNKSFLFPRKNEGVNSYAERVRATLKNNDKAVAKLLTLEEEDIFDEIPFEYAEKAANFWRKYNYGISDKDYLNKIEDNREAIEQGTL